MKARVIKDPYRMSNLKIGEIVEIIPGMETDAAGIWNVPAGMLVLCKKEDGTFTYASMCDMEVIDYKPVDWSAFRREAAKAAMLGILAGRKAHHGYRETAEEAVSYADALIRRLK